MAGLIADRIVRYAVNGTYAGHNIVNIIDMDIDTTGAADSRAEAAEAQAGIILNEWDDSMLSLLNPRYSAISVSWIDLDSAEGSVGVRAESGGHEWPASGRTGGGGAPGNVCLRVNKNTVATRGQRQGRMYLTGFAESWTDSTSPNSLADPVAGENNPVLASFLGDINQVEGGLIDPTATYSSDMVVVHTAAGVFTGASKVTSLTVDPYTASQVRRIRR